MSDAAIERKVVGGACRNDPTYGLFLLAAPSLRELIKTDVVCFRNVQVEGGHGNESCLRIRNEEYLGLSIFSSFSVVVDDNEV